MSIEKNDKARPKKIDAPRPIESDGDCEISELGAEEISGGCDMGCSPNSSKCGATSG